MRHLEVTYPLTFIIDLEDEDDDSLEAIAERFQNTTEDWLDQGGTVWADALDIREV